MTDKAIELLSKLRAEYVLSQTTSFDSMFYIGYNNLVLSELQNEGYIVIKNDIIGSIELVVK